MHINAASIELCLNNPTLLLNRKGLLELARSKVIEEGFVFAKGKSRSRIGPIRSQQSKPRQYLSKEIRTARLKHLEDKIKNHNDIVLYKEKQIAACLSISNFSQCEELKTSIINLKEVINELEKEKRCITISNKKSKWYEQKKQTSSLSISQHESSHSENQSNTSSEFSDTEFTSSHDSSQSSDGGNISGTSCIRHNEAFTVEQVPGIDHNSKELHQVENSNSMSSLCSTHSPFGTSLPMV